MRDPGEGVAADGTIRTGVARSRVAPAFEPVLAAATAACAGLPLHLYGSVATGQAVIGRSDVDLMSIGLPTDRARAASGRLTERFVHLCRGVELSAAGVADRSGPGDEAYGNRVFLRHYCVQISGPAEPAEPPFPADVRAARGFNGDIARHLARWQARPPTSELGRIVARKTLLAVAGLVSVHDTTWTTDRATAAARWAEISPADAPGLRRLLSWTDGGAPPDDVPAALDGVVARVAERFATAIGLWP